MAPAMAVAGGILHSVLKPEFRHETFSPTADYISMEERVWVMKGSGRLQRLVLQQLINHHYSSGSLAAPLCAHPAGKEGPS